MLVFTADEAWSFVPFKPLDERGLPSVHLTRLPTLSGVDVSPEQLADWGMLLKLREDVLMQLDVSVKRRKESDAAEGVKGSYKALDYEVVFPESLCGRLEAYGVDLEDMAGCGYHSFGDVGSVTVIDRRETYPACARSWKRRPDVGSDSAYPDLCRRDATAVRARWA